MNDNAIFWKNSMSYIISVELKGNLAHVIGPLILGCIRRLNYATLLRNITTNTTTTTASAIRLNLWRSNKVLDVPGHVQ